MMDILTQYDTERAMKAAIEACMKYKLRSFAQLVEWAVAEPGTRVIDALLDPNLRHLLQCYFDSRETEKRTEDTND